MKKNMTKKSLFSKCVAGTVLTISLVTVSSTNVEAVSKESDQNTQDVSKPVSIMTQNPVERLQKVNDLKEKVSYHQRQALKLSNLNDDLYHRVKELNNNETSLKRENQELKKEIERLKKVKKERDDVKKNEQLKQHKVEVEPAGLVKTQEDKTPQEDASEGDESNIPSQSNVSINKPSSFNGFASGYMVGDGFTPSTITASGEDVSNGRVTTSEGYRIVASIAYPMHTKLRITFANGKTINASVEDTGYLAGNQVDVLVSSLSELYSLVGGKSDCFIEVIS